MIFWNFFISDEDFVFYENSEDFLFKNTLLFTA